MLCRVAAAAGRRADDCARLRRLVDWARRPPCDSSRRTERRPDRAEGAGKLAHWVAAAVGLQQAWVRLICRADGVERSVDVHERASSLVRSAECLQQVQCQVAADGKEQLLVDSKDLGRAHEMSGDGRVGDGQCSKMRLSSRCPADRRWLRALRAFRAGRRHQQACCCCSSWHLVYFDDRFGSGAEELASFGIRDEGAERRLYRTATCPCPRPHASLAHACKQLLQLLQPLMQQRTGSRL